MAWLILLLFLFANYYIIVKVKSKIIEKYFSLLSLILLMLMATPLWNDKLFLYVAGISLFLPFVLGLLGVIFGWFGIKGDVRIILIGINILALFFYLFIFLMATIGFQEP